MTATYDAGAIEGTLTLDRKPFLQGMKAAQAQAKAFEDKKYTARLDVDTRSASTKLTNIQRKLDDLAGKTASITVDADTARALASIGELQSQLDNIDRDRVQPRVDVDLSGVETRLDQLLFQLERLDTDHVEPRVDVDTAGASAQVAELQAQLDRLDHSSATPRVDSSGFTNASIGMQLLVAGAAALAPILVPTLAGGAAAAIGLGAALGTAAAGLPVLALGFSGIVGAVKALSTQQTTAVASTRNLASSQGQLQSAVRALANARANAADQAVAAAERVRNAEQSLGQAEAAEEAAVRSLSQARVEARQHLQDLAFATEDADLALRSANLEVRQAKADLDALNKTVGDSTHAQALLTEAQTAYQNLLANPQATEQQREQAAAAIVNAERQVQAAKDGTSATALQREQAQLAYDEAVQRQKEAKVSAQRAAQDQADAQKKGIAGSDAVVAAEQKIADAQRQVQQAQQSLADAERAQATQRRQSAYSVAQAQQAVANAQRQVAQSSTGAAGGLSQVQKAMDGLSPAGRRFALFLFSLRGYWKDLQATAQSGLLPGVESGIRAMLPLFPKLITFVGTMAGAFGDLFDEAGHALNAPFWRKFFDFVNRTAGPNAILFGEILGNLAKAGAGLVIAFEPFGHDLLTWLEKATGKFATWSTTLGQSQGFKTFMTFVRTNGPLVVDMLVAFAKAVLQIGIALAPYAGPILTFLTGLFTAIANADPDTIRGVATAIGGLFLALTGAKAAKALTNLPLLGGLLGKVAPAGPWLLLGGAIAGIGLYAVKSTGHWKDFTGALKKGDVAGALKIGLESFLEMVKNVGPKFVKNLNHALKTTDWHEAGKTFGTAIVNALSFAGVSSAKLTKAIIQLLAKVDWSAVGSAAAGFLGGLLQGLFSTAISTGLSTALSTIEQTATALFKSSLLGLGYDIISGLVKGMDNAWLLLIPGLQLFKLVGLIKKWLGIHSPSTVFFGIGQDVIRGLINGLNSLGGSLFNAARGAGGQITNGIVPGLRTLRTWLSTTLPGAENTLNQHTKTTFNSLTSTTSTGVSSGLVPPLRSWRDWLTKTLPTALQSMRGANTSAWSSIVNQTTTGENSTAAQLQQMRHATSLTATAFGNMANAAQKAWRNIKDSAREPVRFLINVVYNQGIARAFNSMAKAVGLGKSKQLDTINTPAQLRDGGPVRGPGGPRTDSVPLWGSNGEYMVNARSTAKYRPIIEAINRDELPGYRDGGLIGADAVTHQIQPALHMPAFSFGQLQSIWDKATKGLASLVTGGGTVGSIAAQATRNMQAAGSKFWAQYDMVGGGNSFIEILKSVLGTPYLWGGMSPGGFDCSGLVWWALNKLGIHAPRTSREQYAWSKHIGAGAAVPGDLVFWDPGNIHHVGVNIGGHKMIDAPHTGAKVRIEDIWPHALYGRIPGLAAKIVGGALGGIKNFVGRGVARGEGLAWATLHGITGSRWTALDYVISHESSWNPRAQNPRSSAWGLGQLIAANRAKYHYDTTVPKQLAGTVAYMNDRYGGIIPAANYWKKHHFYDTGGLADGPGALFKGPKPERMLSPRQTVAFEDLIPHLVRLADTFAMGELGGKGITMNVTQNAAPGLTSEQDLERLMRKVETRLRVGRRS